MTEIDITPTSLPAWHRLENLAQTAQRLSMPELFAQDQNRTQRMTLEVGGLLLDYSKNLIDEEIWQALLSLAKESKLAEHRDALFAGKLVNTTEHRAACHPQLRKSTESGGSNQASIVTTDNIASQKQVHAVSEQIRAGKWLGSSGKPLRHIVHIGIGGSASGPQLCCEALRGYADPGIDISFISNVDGAEILTLLERLDPEQTLVIAASKTFTTQETLINTQTAISWFEEQLGLDSPQSSSHFIAITAQPENAERFGIATKRILTFDESVGGRYSLWSSIGLPVAIAIGYENFCKLLEGAVAMDDHFTTVPFESNMPVILALIGIWYNNFMNAETLAIVPYCQRLERLPSYLQQMDMESNGKSVSQSGEPLSYATGPIIWGQTGTNAQHAFFQLLHQGSHLIPVDFISTINDPLSNHTHHSVLLSNMLAQSAALMSGRKGDALPTYRHCPGNRPSNTLLCNELTPYTLGQLIALYEHKVFVQGSIWNINSYDQWGVELGKEIAQDLQSAESLNTRLDESTQRLSHYIAQKSRT